MWKETETGNHNPYTTKPVKLLLLAIGSGGDNTECTFGFTSTESAVDVGGSL